jgi:Cof subfamily protein (haloacid dehalogenase superfamily)
MSTLRIPSGQSRPAHVRLIAIDLDGTILDPHQRMTHRSVDAVASVRTAGIPVIPATSRGVLSAYEILPLAKFGPVAVCANGAATLNLEDGTIICERPIELVVAYSLIEDLRADIPSLSLAAETTAAFFGEEWIMKRSMHQSDRQVVKDTGASLTQAPLKLFATAPGMDPEVLTLTITRTIKNRASVSIRDSWVELCAPGVNKAPALDELSSLLGIDQANVLSVGDAENDLDMLEWTGISAAVQNAVPSVLAVADLIIPSNSEDGVAVLLEELTSNNFVLYLPER